MSFQHLSILIKRVSAIPTLLLISLVSCAPQEVEVTRVVEQEIDVTRLVELPMQVEVTRMVTEEIEVTRVVEQEVEVEVTRIVETVPGTSESTPAEESNQGPPAFEPPTAVIASGLRSPRQMVFTEDGTLYIAEAGTAGDSPVQADPETTITTGLTGQISAVRPDGSQEVVLPALPSTNRGNDDTGYRGPQAILVTDDSYWIGVGEGPESLFGLSFFYAVYEIDRETWRIKNTIDTAAAAAVLGQPDPAAVNSDPADLALSGEGTLYIADAGCNCLWSWTEATGIEPFHLWGIDDNPVPTGVSVGPDGDIYVSLLSGFPFPVGGTRIERYSSEGELLQVYEGLTMATDVLVDDDGTIYAVELAQGLGERGFVPDSGRVVIVDDGGVRPLMEGLRLPYGLAQDADGNLFVSVVSAFDPTGGGMVIAVDES